MKKNSIERRQAAASAAQLNALSTFEKVAVDLDEAAEQHEAIANEASNRAAELKRLSYDSAYSAGTARSAAHKLRELVR